MSDTDWMGDALCKEVGLDLFFPEKGENITAARRTCMACPVTAACLDYAVLHHIDFGVWGGTSPRQRRRIRHNRGAQERAA